MALNFTAASSQYLSRGSVVASYTPLTLAAWAYVTDTTAGRQFIAISQAGSGTRLASLGFSSAQQKVYASSYDNVTNSTVYANATAPGNTWLHAAGTFDSLSSRNVYMNGANKVSSTTAVTSFTLDTTAIGAARINTTTTNFMNGWIAFPAVWNVSLTDAEVASLAAGISPRKIRPQNLVSYCRLVGASPEPDIIGGSWTLTGAPTVTPNSRIFRP